MACFSPIVNTRGAVFVHDKGIVKRTTYHVFWMYTHLLQPNVVPVSVDCGNLSDGWRVVPAVDAILTASDDGKRRALAVVNKSPDKAVSFDISAIAARSASAPYQATVLSGASTDDYNDIGAENRVVPVKTTFEVKDGKVSLPPHSISIIDLSTAAGGCDALKPVAMQDVKVDGFWRNQYRRLICKWIPHCIRQMEAGGKGEELLNLVATGEVLAGKTPSVKFKGCPWSDAYVYNTMEAISLALEISPGDDSVMAQGQRRLREKMEEWIPIILAAQEPSGYIHSFHDLRKKPHFTKAGDHEFYVMGYFIEMGVAHWRMTKGKDRRLFDAAIKCADHLDSVFGPAPKRTWLNGHPGLEYALCRLADAVNASDGAGKGDKYARLAQHFIRNQHVAAGKNYGWQSLYHQAERPATEMKDATGHAVRATYFYTAMSALASRLGDKELGAAADRLFDSAINRKEYLTGGVGASWRGEAFAGDYELANNGYCESCASCGMSFWTIEQHKRHGDSWPVDVQERLMYNNLLGSISEDGCNFYYQNPLDSSKVRYPWHGCPCCVGNIPRTLLALKDLAYSLGADGKTLYADHFLSTEGSVGNVAGTRLSIRQVTDYPWSGKVKFTLAPERPVAFTFALRVPDKTDSALYTAVPDVEGRFTVTVNGEKADAEFSRGYARVARTWKAGDVVELEFPMPVQRIQCDERVQANRGRVAFQRGPVVYSFEQIDNSQPLSRLVLDPGVSFQPFWKADLCDGVFAIKGSNGAVAVPNFARLNRGAGRAMVWMVADPVKAGIHKGVFAKVSVSFSRGSMTPNIPKANDTEVKNGNFDFWPHLATKEWIRYDFDEETEFSKSAVVWFDDRAQKGNCRYPASWTLSALQGDGSWKKLAESHTPVKDGWDEASFAPVKTRALRLDVQLPPGFSAGVREWKVD